MNAWYLLYCKPRNELRAQQNLEMQKIQTYLPMITEEKKQKGTKLLVKTPLFPNYIFAKFDPTVMSVTTIKSTRGVSHVIDCREQMIPLCHLVFALRQQEKLTSFQCATDSSTHVVDVLDDESVPEFTAGDKVKFIDGPFANLEGIFEQKSTKKRGYILLEVLGKIQSTRVPLSQLTAI